MMILRGELLVATVAWAVFASAIGVAEAQSLQGIGRTIGDSSVSDSGEAGYSIPIVVPPGVNGMTPDLSISYGHRQKEGLAGVGWGISGLSTISRCAKTAAQDGAPENVTLFQTDRFCYGGSQLRLVSGTYGAAGSTYRTEVDMMARFTAYGASGNGPAWFKVEGKDGLIYEYGNTADSFIESLTNYFTDTALTYALNRIVDRHGNEILFTYDEDGAPYGSYRIDSVSYGGNPSQGSSAKYLINFVYETQPAADVDTKNAAGSTVEDIMRMTRVDVWYTPSVPDVLARRYELDYEPSLSSASRSRLASITECASPTFGSSVTCLSPSTFTYQGGTNGMSSEVSSGSSMPAGATPLTIDINGDGRTDLVFSSAATSGNWHYRLANSSGGYEPVVNTGIASTNHERAIATDYNSDGIDDILVPYSGSTWWVIQGSTSGLGAPIDTLAPADSIAGDAITLDISGDGREDLVYRSNGAGKLWARDRLTGNGYSATPYIVEGSFPRNLLLGPVFEGVFNQSRSNHFDANGDGIKDVGIRKKERMGGHGVPISYVYYVKVILGGGAGSYVIGYDSQPMSAGLPIDINGDGYTDVAYKIDLVNTLLYRLSTGKSFIGSAPSTGFSLTNLDLGKALAFDWDNDGYQDLLVPNTSTDTWYYARSTGTSFATPLNTGVAVNSALSTFKIDANGDGLDDIGYVSGEFNTYGDYAHIPHAGVQPDLLRSATDGYGNSTTFWYQSLTDSLYSRYSDAVFPQQDFISALYVVSSAVKTTGIGSGTYTLSYAYAGAQMNLEGRGLAGFDKKVTTDSRNGVKTEEYFLRDFPYRGRPYQRNLLQSDNTPIQEATFTWDSVQGGTDYQSFAYPYLKESLEKNYEAEGTQNGALLTEVLTTNVVDSYGTPIDITRVTTEKDTANGIQADATFTEQVKHSMMSDNETSWCLGKPGKTEWINSHSPVYGTQITRTVTRSWDTSSYCRLDSQTTEPGDLTYEVIRALGYDAFGNINSETVTGVGMSPRTAMIDYGTTGQYPLSATNPLGQVSNFGWDFAKGLQTSITDANLLTTSYWHDEFGRPILEQRPDGTKTAYELTECALANNYCGTSYDRVRTQARVISQRTDSSEIRHDDSFLDILDRPVIQESQVIGGGTSRTRTIYDNLGRVAQQSAPSFDTNPSNYYFTTTSYDVLNRPIHISRPIDANTPALQSTTILYRGMVTKTTDAEGKITTKIVDALGRVLRSKNDHTNYYQQFAYDAFGSLRRTKDKTGNIMMTADYAYGITAHRISSDDMDLGAWTYSPNALGEVVAYTDAKGQNFSAIFDKLSRPLVRTEPDETTTWVWGASAVAKNIGKLSSISNSGHSESRNYDGFGRLSRRRIITDATYDINFDYDSTSGLLDTLTYPISAPGVRLKLQYGYEYGLLNSVSNFNVPTTIFWQADASDPRGNVVDQLLGNGVRTIRGFDEVTGLPDYIQSGPGGGSSLQDMEFLWNKVSSLKQRKDVVRSLTEEFFYDDVHRLDYSELNGNQNLDITYDADGMGNIIYKSDVPGGGAFTYHATKKHAVLTAGSNSYAYDNNGNQTTRNSQTVTWTSYNYPSHIPNGLKYHDYSYDGNRQKWKQVYFDGTTSETTYYATNLYEKNVNAIDTDHRHYIYANGVAVAAYIAPEQGSNYVQYYLRDHLGSMAAILNQSGTAVVYESFAAYGEHRDATDWIGPPSAAAKSAMSLYTDRGYTDHTNMEESSFVHMNGRVADALTGRFLSPDPYVPNPGITESFNRYSYVRNNPLTYTDPSGFFECFDVFSCTFNAFGTFASFLGFDGKVKVRDPQGCWVAPTACLGKSFALKMTVVLSDIVELTGTKATLDNSQTGSPATTLKQLSPQLRTQVTELLANEDFQKIYNDAISEIESAQTNQLTFDRFETDYSLVREAGAIIESQNPLWGLRSPFDISDVGSHVLDGETRGSTYGNRFGGNHLAPVKLDRAPVAIIGKDSRFWSSKPQSLRDLSDTWNTPVPVINHAKDGRMLYIGGHGPIPLD